MPKPLFARELPPLEKEFGVWRGFHQQYDVSRSVVIADLLTAFIKKERVLHQKAVTFYSIPQIRQYFKVSSVTASRAYNILSDQGLILKIRSSKTLMLPETAQTQSTIRGIVGLPVWETGFCLFSHNRLFYKAMNNALTQKQQATNFSFFYGTESASERFIQGYFTQKIDSLLWFFPNDSHIQNLRLCQDHGIKVYIITDPYSRFPFPQYILDYRSSIRKTLKRWKAEGVQKVICPVSTASLKDITKLLKPLMDENKMSFEAVIFYPRKKTNLIHRKWPNSTAMILGDIFTDQDITTHHLSPLKDFLRKTRTLALHSLDLYADDVQDIKMDFAIINWEKTAAYIASDIASNHPPKDPVTIQADYHPLVNAAQFAHC